MTKAPWVADRQAERLPVPYFHGVLTLPPALHALVLVHQRPLLTLLVRAASQTLLQCGRQNLGPRSPWPQARSGARGSTGGEWDTLAPNPSAFLLSRPRLEHGLPRQVP